MCVQFSAGPVYVKWNTVDAQMVGGTHMLVLATGQSTLPVSRSGVHVTVWWETNWFMSTHGTVTVPCAYVGVCGEGDG